jgi:hypothetical protein
MGLIPSVAWGAAEGEGEGGTSPQKEGPVVREVAEAGSCSVETGSAFCPAETELALSPLTEMKWNF